MMSIPALLKFRMENVQHAEKRRQKDVVAKNQGNDFMKVCIWRNSATDDKKRMTMPRFCKERECNGVFHSREPMCEHFHASDEKKNMTEKEAVELLNRRID